MKNASVWYIKGDVQMELIVLDGTVIYSSSFKQDLGYTQGRHGWMELIALRSSYKWDGYCKLFNRILVFYNSLCVIDTIW